MNKWMSIDRLHSLVKYFRNGQKEGFPPPAVRYAAKPKIHGTNAAVSIDSNGFRMQSRNNVVESGHMGFVDWAQENREVFEAARSQVRDTLGDVETTFFGEWCGPGIQQGTSINKIGRKVFCLFGVFGDKDQVVFNPNFLNPLFNHKDIFVLPFVGPALTLDFGSPASIEESAEIARKMVVEADEVDPWIKETFGVEGPGEGYVWFPLQGWFLNEEVSLVQDVEWTSRHIWKAKGEKHGDVVKKKRPVATDPEVMKTIEEFLDRYVTEARLKQGVEEGTGGDFDIRRTGDFLKWFNSDVCKESRAELEASEINWKSVAPYVSRRAASWFKERCL